MVAHCVGIKTQSQPSRWTISLLTLVSSVLRPQLPVSEQGRTRASVSFPRRQVATFYSHCESSTLRFQGQCCRAQKTAQQVLQRDSALPETQLRHTCTNCVPSSAILAPVFLPLPLVALHSKNRNCARVPLHAVRMQQRPRRSARSAAARDLRRVAFGHISLVTCPSTSLLRPSAISHPHHRRKRHFQYPFPDPRMH